MKKSIWPFLSAALALALAVPSARAQRPGHVYEGRLDSAYEARSLPVFEIDAAFYQPAVARQRLERVLAGVAGRELAPASAEALRRSTPDDRTVWTGASPEDPGLRYMFDRANGRLEVVQERFRNVRPWERTGPVVSREEALGRARDFIQSLHQAGVLQRNDFDLENLEVGAQKTGIARKGESPGAAREWVDNYRITAKRVVNGVPVVGSGVRVVVDASGAVSEVGMAYRQFRSEMRAGRPAPAGRGRSVSVDRTPDQAKALFESGLGLPLETRLHVERWGLAYLDTGAAGQAFYQPVYIFAATPLTEAEHGTIAGRQVIRVVPASATTLEAISFDPFRNAPAPADGGDPRPDR